MRTFTRMNWTRSKKLAGREGMTTMLLTTTTITKNTSPKPDKPWIHVRAALIEKLWMGLAVFSTGGAWTTLPGQEQPFADANA